MTYAGAYYWLAATCIASAVMFMPYVLNRIFRQGLFTAIGGTPEEDTPPVWAQRSQNAHSNAVENLVIFAPLVIAAIATGVDAGTVAQAAMIYFWARVLHYVVYTAGIPAVRTLLFFVGLGVQLYLGWLVIGAVS